jgi:SNF2 family DNA or RNA helicase
MRTRDQLRSYQQRCVDFINAGEDALIYADVGTGKTAIGLTAMVDNPFRWLVVAPEKVARLRWPAEVGLWEHTAHLQLRAAIGTPKKRLEVLNDRSAQIVTLSYENLEWFLYQAPNAFQHFRFQGVFFDEVDKLKDPSTKRFKALRVKKGTLLAPLKKRVGATGTPTPDHLLDVWAQAYVTDLGESLGTSFDRFRKRYFFPTDFYQHNWAPFPKTQEEIYDKLAGLVERVSRDDCADMPAVIDLEPRYLDLPPPLLKQYRRLERTLSFKIDHDTSIDAASAGSLSGMLQQFASGFLYTEFDGVHALHDLKFDDLDELVSELQGQQLLVVYHFIQEAREIQRRYPQSRRLGGGVGRQETDATIEAWNAGKLEMLVLHRQSAGHGLDLQLSQAAHIYFMTRPWSAGSVEQVVGRLARPGGAPHVWIHTPVVRHTIDQDVLTANAVKGGWQDAFRAAFKARVAQLETTE